MTPLAQAVVDQWRRDSGPFNCWLALDLTEEDIRSAPDYIIPGLVSAREMARETDPYRWIDPFGRY